MSREKRFCTCNLKALISKLLSQLHIPSEREIRELQLRQVKRTNKQINNSEKSVTDIRLNCEQRLRRRNTSFSNKSEIKTSNELNKKPTEKQCVTSIELQ